MRRVAILLLATAAVLFGIPAFAVTFPEHTGFVTDAAHLLVPAERDALEHELHDLEAATTWEVAVVTIPTLEGETVDRYAQDLFVAWGIGKKGENNGVLLLVARQERKLRIHTGYHAESYLPDIVCKHIITDDIAKKTKQEDWSGGIADGTRHIAQIVRDAKDHPEKTAVVAGPKDDDVPGWVLVVLLLGFLGIVFFVVIASGRQRSSYYYSGGAGGGGGYRSGGYGGSYYSGGSSSDSDSGGSSWGGSSDSSSSSSSSFDFGGGDSGGGGASGDG